MATARTRLAGKETKSTLLIWELKRYGIFAAGISETNWFGNNIYEVEECTILHSGRETRDGEQVRRGEGVGLVLSPEHGGWEAKNGSPSAQELVWESQ